MLALGKVKMVEGGGDRGNQYTGGKVAGLSGVDKPGIESEVPTKTESIPHNTQKAIAKQAGESNAPAGVKRMEKTVVQQIVAPLNTMPPGWFEIGL